MRQFIRNIVTKDLLIRLFGNFTMYHLFDVGKPLAVQTPRWAPLTDRFRRL